MTTDLTKLPEGWKPADLRNAIDEVKASNAAHARLIAAAPDLLEALKDIERLRLATNEGTCAQRFDQAWRIATSAIAKAEGRS